MAKKISQMETATEIKNGDISVLVQDGTTKKFNLDLLPSKAQIDNYKADVESQLSDYEQEIIDIKNEYDKELYTPEISVTGTPMIKTGQGDSVDYSANVEDGVAKSAILKGNTLINLLANNNIKITSNGFKGINYTYQLNTTKTYIIQYRINQLPELSDTSESDRAFKFEWYNGSSAKGHKNIYIKDLVVKSNVYIKIEPFSDDVSRTNFGIWCPNYMSGTLDIDIMIIEYQEGMENWDVPYFTGMQSVKMPVLMTVGKNLFNKSKITNNIKLLSTGGTLSESGTSVSDFIPVLPNVNYYFTYGNTYKSRALCFYDENKLFISGLSGASVIKIITPINCKYVRFNIASNELDNVQFEQGSVATSYEPFKSNILTVNEDVILRSNGGVYDELDLLTGKLTQRIDEDGEILAKEAIKTVVLEPSGTLASETPYMWKDGSIQLSSDGLIPNLDYAVTTSRVGVIETNMSETIANEKRIHSLEVLLAQATVNSAYDTVSLQSDVEVATMSLDTESTQNEVDNFLYDMILLLIENNAYDESLFDKVSVFYLYGKLSDEQFINIYNLLYQEEM